MWFLLLGIALVIVFGSGLYFRSRVLSALQSINLIRGLRARKRVGLLILWLLFGVPVIVFVSIVVSLIAGSESLYTGPKGIGEWLLVYPFWLTVLVTIQSVPLMIVFELIGSAAVFAKKVERAHWQRVRGWGVLAIVTAFTLYTPTRILLERNTINVNRFEVGDRVADGHSKLFRIAFVADLQLDTHTGIAKAREVANLVNHENVDIVLAGGDWINTGPDFIETAGKAAGLFRSRLGTSSVRGDHEHFAFRDQEKSAGDVGAALAANGAEMIDNEVRTIEHHGKRIAIVYLNYNYIVRTKAGLISKLLDQAQSADYRILVTHQFDSKLAELVRDRVDLALIAHTHGGQVNPFIGFTHVSIARVETPYVAGRYQLGKTTLIVTSGIGFSIAPFRYAAPASLEFIDIRI